MSSGNTVGSRTLLWGFFAALLAALSFYGCGNDGGAPTRSTPADAVAPPVVPPGPPPVVPPVVPPVTLAPITSIADAGGGNILVTAANTGTLNPGDLIIISGTLSYNNGGNAYSVISANATTFTVAAVFGASEAGFWQLGGGVIAGCTDAVVGGAAATITPSRLPSRVQGVAPLMVFFDASPTTATAAPGPLGTFHNHEFRWNFGDTAAPGNWGDRTTGSSGTGFNTSRNEAYGPVAAHVYETPGTYTVTLTVTDGTNTISNACLRIAVQDPNVLFAANTVCVGGQTLPVPGVTPGCPASATAVQQPDLSQVINTQINTGKRRVLLAGGEFFNTPGPGLAMIAVNGPGILGSFPAGTKAILQTNAPMTQFSDILRVNGNAVTHGSDWRLMDLEFDGQNNGNAQAIFGVGRFDQLTMLRLNIHDIGGAIEIPMQSATPPLHDQLALVDSTIERLLSSGGPTGSSTHGILSAASQTAILGNLFNDSTIVAAEHMIRIQYMDRGVIGHNRVMKVAANKEMLALRAPCSAACPLPTGSNNHFPTLVADGATAATRKVVISDNQFDTNTFAGVKIGPVNNNDPALINHVVLQRNFYINVAGGGGGITAQADQITIRNEIIDISISTLNQGIGLDSSAVNMPPASNVRVYNNTIFSSTASAGTFQGVALAPATTFIDIRNNLARAPLAANPQMVRDFGASGPLTNTNNSTDLQIGIGGTDPNFVTATPLAPSDYRLTGAVSTYPRDTGALLPVHSDFFRVARPAGAGFDLGATEQ